MKAISGALRGALPLVLLGISLGAGSCGGTAAPMGMPTLQIVQPTQGQSIQIGSSFLTQVAVTNFEWVTPGSAPNAPNQGHWHIYLNPDLQNYLLAASADQAMVTIPRSATPGMQTLTVNLRNNDHTLVMPLVQATVQVNLTP
jgi:hypothetical protein